MMVYDCNHTTFVRYFLLFVSYIVNNFRYEAEKIHFVSFGALYVLSGI